jgi:thiosulfate/3-mercaptopyruvate sulfurtransferase
MRLPAHIVSDPNPVYKAKHAKSRDFCSGSTKMRMKLTMPGHLIDVPSLKALLNSSECRLVDCRSDLFDPDKGRADYLAGHLPGAVHADMDKDLASEVMPETGRHPLPDVDAFCRTLESWGIGNETHVVAYDSGNGALAVRLWWMLKWLGHDNVSVLNGGVAAWSVAGEALETTTPKWAPAEFSGSADDSLVATTEEIASALTSGQEINLIDARDEGRFRGDFEPIDSVAGRIPGARNYPLSRNLTEDGYWRSAQELEAIWAEFQGGESDRATIVMCGSGVTACHLIMSAALAGQDLPRLYVGSWSEWIRDKNRPVATGD